MGSGATLELVSAREGEWSVAIEVSFTGGFAAPSPLSPLAGLELEFVEAALSAHGSALEISERAGRTRLRFELPSAMQTLQRESLTPALRAA